MTRLGMYLKVFGIHNGDRRPILKAELPSGMKACHLLDFDEKSERFFNQLCTHRRLLCRLHVSIYLKERPPSIAPL
jgi:hypothetical protein